MKKIIAMLLASMMVVGLFAGCGSKDDSTASSAPAASGSTQSSAPADSAPEAITLKVWAPQEDQVDSSSWLPQMLAKFEEAHPEYTITWDLGVCGEGDAGNTVKNDPAAAADVYLFANDQLGTLIEAGALAELGGDYLAQVQNGVSATYLSSVTHSDGGVYGFPVAPNTWYMYYNKDVFTEEDVKSLDTMITKGVVAFPFTTGWYAGAFFMGNGGSVFGPNGNDAAAGIQFGGEAGYATAKYMIDLAANPNVVNDADGRGNAGLKDGTVAAYFSGNWEYAGLYEVLGDKLGAVQLPAANIGGKAVSMKAFAGTRAVGVNPNAKNQKAAMQLASFLASEESQLARFEMRGITPALTALAESDAVKASLVAQAEMAVMSNTSMLQPGIPEMSNYWAPMQTFGENIINGSVTHDNVQAQVDAFVESLNSSGL